jgi:hypothetical protein
MTGLTVFDETGLFRDISELNLQVVSCGYQISLVELTALSMTS